MPLAANRFPSKLALNVPNNIVRNTRLSFVALFLFFLLTSFINKPDSSRDLVVYMISFISALEIVNIVLPDPNCFL